MGALALLPLLLASISEARELLDETNATVVVTGNKTDVSTVMRTELPPFRDSFPLIVGGTLAPQGRYPYMVNIADNSGIYCGGSLIASNVVMCAAHCSGSKKVYIGRWNLGSNTEEYEEFNVQSEIKHPSYNGNSQINDFMLIRISGVSTISPVILADGTENLPLDSDPNQMLNVMGWGATSSGGSGSPRLLEAAVKYVPNNQCANNYGPGQIFSMMMCAASPNKDSCQGDSGGPLIIKGSNAGKDVQVGVVSWGYGCADPNYPGVYARISSVRPWIVSTLNGWGVQLPSPGGPTPPGPSPTACCKDLPGFTNIDGDDVCAARQWSGQSCVAQATYNQAEYICSSVGARLCTMEEIEDRQASGTGCGFDSKLVWTSSACGNGDRLMGRGDNGAGKKCGASSAKAAVSCCANVCTSSPSSILCPPSDRLAVKWLAGGKLEGRCVSTNTNDSISCGKDEFDMVWTASGVRWSCK